MSDQFQRLQQAQAARRQMLADYRSNRLHEMTLPRSGLTVFVQDVTMTDLVLTGKLPATIVDFAEKAAINGKAEIDLREIAKEASDLGKLLDITTMLCVVEPPIAEIGDENHLSINEIPADDKQAVFDYINREVKPLADSFPEGQDQPIQVIQHGDGLQSEAERLPAAGNGSGAMDAG